VWAKIPSEAKPTLISRAAMRFWAPGPPTGTFRSICQWLYMYVVHGAMENLACTSSRGDKEGKHVPLDQALREGRVRPEEYVRHRNQPN